MGCPFTHVCSQDMVDLSGVTWETESLPPETMNFRSSSVRGRECNSLLPLHARVSIGLICCWSCSGSHSCFEFMNVVALLCPEETISLYPLRSLTLAVFLPLLCGGRKSLGRGNDIHVPCVAEPSTGIHSLHGNWVSALATIHCIKKTSLMRADNQEQMLRAIWYYDYFAN